jgi:hypothetical protein
MRTFVAAALAGLVLYTPAVAFAPADRITKNGLGDVEIGMTIAQVENEIGHALNVQYLHDESCGNAVLGKDVFAIFTYGRLMRIDVATARYQTRKGVHVGHRASTVYARYGSNVRAIPHAYTRGQYLRVTMGRRRIVFQTTATGRVDQIAVGRIPEVDYVEGCA